MEHQSSSTPPPAFFGCHWFSGKWIPRRAVFSLYSALHKNYAMRGNKSSSNNHHFDTFRKKNLDLISTSINVYSTKTANLFIQPLPIQFSQKKKKTSLATSSPSQEKKIKQHIPPKTGVSTQKPHLIILYSHKPMPLKAGGIWISSDTFPCGGLGYFGFGLSTGL